MNMTTGSYPPDCISHLKSGQLVLMPSDTIWVLAWRLSQTQQLERVLKARSPDPEEPMIVLFQDLEQMKAYINNIHPRVETLLTLHHRPLGIIYPQIINVPQPYLQLRDRLAFQVSHYSPLVKLLEQLSEPLVTISAGRKNQYATDIVEVNPDLMQLAEHRTLPVLSPEPSGLPSVIATYKRHKGELKFIRD